MNDENETFNVRYITYSVCGDSPFFGCVGAHPNYESYQGHKFNIAECFLHCPISSGLQYHKILLNRYNNIGYFRKFCAHYNVNFVREI